MKLTFILLLPLILSCSTKSGKDELDKAGLQKVDIDLNELNQIVEENIVDSFSSHLSTKKIDLKKLKNFSAEFLIKYVANKNVKFGFAKEFSSDFPESFYFYQGKKYCDFYLLTFLHTDEVCCTTLYGATFSNKTDSLISLAAIAYDGGDGGWFGEQRATWVNDFQINTVEYSEYDDDLNEDTINSEIDSTWNEIQLSTNGDFRMKEIKKSSYLGNKKIK